MPQSAAHHPGPDPHRSLAVAIVVCEAGMVMMTAGAWGFASLAAILALGSSLVVRRRGALPLGPRWLWGLGLVCLLKAILSPYPIPDDLQFIRTEFAHEFARFLIAVQLFVLYTTPWEQRIPNWFLGMSWVVLIFASDLRIPMNRQWIQQSFVIAVILLGVWKGMAARRHASGGVDTQSRFRFLPLAVLVTALIAGVGIAEGIQKHEREIEWFIIRYLSPVDERPATIGFSGRGTLGSVSGWRLNQTEELVLRVSADRMPGYLDGRVFDRIERGQFRTEWHTEEPTRRVPYVRLPPGHLAQVPLAGSLFGLFADPEGNWERYDIWSRELGRLFVPSRTELLSVPAETILYSEGSYFPHGQEPGTELHYQAFVPRPTSPVILSTEELDRCLQVHDTLDPGVYVLAERIFADCVTVEEKCRAVVNLMHAEYSYVRQKLITNVPDHLSHFLLVEKAGHCEFFASAAAVLLRLGNVPTKYVTGFIVEERNPVDGTWVARRKHAHAWAMAYDDQTSEWRIVEATPPSGVPETTPTSWWNSRIEALQFAWNRWREQAQDFEGLPSPASWLTEYWLIPLMIVLIAIGCTLVSRRWLFTVTAPFEVESPPPPHLARLLNRLDRLARQAGFRREESETLLAFAVRLEQSHLYPLAETYRLYAGLRYAPTVSSCDLQCLEHQVRSLKLPSSRKR